MREQMVYIISFFIAGILAMILHELPKAILYYFYSKRFKEKLEETKEKSYVVSQKNQKIWQLHHYIDPIGLLFCVIMQVGFSKPYYYRIREKKLSCLLGVVGLGSLLIQALISMGTMKFIYGVNGEMLFVNSTVGSTFFIYFLYSYSIICIAMFLSNLFPLVAFDMGLLVASASPVKFYTILRGDYLIKMVWLFTALLGLFQTASEVIYQIFML